MLESSSFWCRASGSSSSLNFLKNFKQAHARARTFLGIFSRLKLELELIKSFRASSSSSSKISSKLELSLYLRMRNYKLDKFKDKQNKLNFMPFSTKCFHILFKFKLCSVKLPQKLEIARKLELLVPSLRLVLKLDLFNGFQESCTDPDSILKIALNRYSANYALRICQNYYYKV